MKQTWTRFTSVMLIGSLAAVTAGCGASSENGSGQDAGAQKKPIKFMHMFDSNVTANAQSDLIAKFKADNPDIPIEEEIQSHDNYETKIKTLAAANELPDVFLIKSSMVNTFVENGLVLPLDEYLNQDAAWKNGFVQGALDPYTVEGKPYAIQFSGGPTHVIFYNKDLIQQAGFNEFPKTWDEFVNLIGALNGKNITPIAFGNKGKWVANSSYLSTLGDRFTGTAWFDSLKDNKGAKFTDPEFVQALAKFQDLAKIGAFNSDMNSIDNNQQRTLFYNEKAAMFIEGAWAVSALEQGAPKEIAAKTELAVFPEIAGAKGEQNTVSGGGGWAHAINANVDKSKVDDIIKMIKSLSDSKAAEVILKYGDVPSSKVEDMSKIEISPLTQKLITLLETKKYVPIYDSHLSPGLIESMNTSLQDMLIGRWTPQQAAEAMQKEYDKEMK